MCCECKCGGDSDDPCNCGGNLIKESRTQEGRVKVAFYCLNLNLLLCSCFGFVTSLVGIAVLTPTGDLGELGFAKWAPLSICALAIILGSVTCRVPVTARYKASQILYAITVALVISFLFASGIIVLLYGKYANEIAYQDSRFISGGFGSSLRIMANDRVMAAWNACCVNSLLAGFTPVKDCQVPNACTDQQGPCACYQEENVYWALYPSPNDCALLQNVYVPTVYNDSFIYSSLVGSDKGSCGGGDPKRFQQYAMPLLGDSVSALGATYIVISCIMLVWAGCSVDMMYAGFPEQMPNAMKRLEEGTSSKFKDTSQENSRRNETLPGQPSGLEKQQSTETNLAKS